MIPQTGLIGAAVLVLTLPACAYRASTNAWDVIAIIDVRSIDAAQTQYSAQYGHFAANLSELRAADLIPASLASGKKDGFKFTMTSTPNGFAINATPRVYGETGRRSFYSDETMVIRQNGANAPASASSPELK